MTRTRPSMRVQFILVTAALLASTIQAAAAGAAPWWNSFWRCRREVTVSYVRASGLSGDEIAVVTMPTGGFIKPNGSDVRVLAPPQTVLPQQVLMVGPGDQVTVAFAARPNVETYYVYFGNEGDPPPGPALEVRRGVLMETWEFRGGDEAGLPAVTKVFASERPVLGRAFRDKIFQGYNPFGPQSKIVSRFTGYFLARTSGAYGFACSSRDASYLFIDDSLVYRQARSGGNPARRPNPKSVSLKAGIHKIAVYHISQSGDPVVLVAWRPPGKETLTVMPEGIFPRVYEGQCGPMSRVGVDPDVDFVPQWLGEAFVADRYFERYEFRAMAVGQLPGNAQWRWDFGDGQTSSDMDVQHVYLTPGDYTVTLTAGAGKWSRANRIVVSRPWDHVADGRPEKERLHARIVADYDFGRLSPEANAQAIVLLDRAGESAALQRAGAAFVRRPSGPSKMVGEVLPMYAAALLAEDSASQAAQALAKGAQMTTNAAVSADLLVRAGRVLLDRLGDDAAALRMFSQAVERYRGLTTAPAIQEARLGIGDVWRARGDIEKARQAYDAATDRQDRKPELVPFQRGDLARQVEDYIRRQEFDTARQRLDEWQMAFPRDKLEGYWSLLQVKLLMRQARAAEAAREARTLVNINPDSPYAAELLMQAAEAYVQLGDLPKARLAWRKVVDKYPESPLAAEAAKKLAA